MNKSLRLAAATAMAAGAATVGTLATAPAPASAGTACDTLNLCGVVYNTGTSTLTVTCNWSKFFNDSINIPAGGSSHGTRCKDVDGFYIAPDQIGSTRAGTVSTGWHKISDGTTAYVNVRRR
jgi:hypothetical protein